MSNESLTKVSSISIPYFLPQEPQGPIQLLGTSFYIFGKCFKKVIPFFILYSVFIFVWYFLSDSCGPKNECLKTGIMVALAIFTYLIILYFEFSFLTSGTFQFLNVTQKRDVSFGEASKFGFKKGVPMFFMFLSGTIAIIIGLFLLVLPGIFLLVSFFFATIYIVMGYGIIDSLYNSYEMVRGYWWRMFLNLIVLFLFSLLIIIMYFGITLAPIYYILNAFGIVIENGKEVITMPYLWILSYILMILIVAVFEVFMIIYSTSFVYACFYDLIVRKRLVQNK